MASALPDELDRHLCVLPLCVSLSPPRSSIPLVASSISTSSPKTFHSTDRSNTKWEPPPGVEPGQKVYETLGKSRLRWHGSQSGGLEPPTSPSTFQPWANRIRTGDVSNGLLCRLSYEWEHGGPRGNRTPLSPCKGDVHPLHLGALSNLPIKQECLQLVDADWETVHLNLEESPAGVNR